MKIKLERDNLSKKVKTTTIKKGTDKNVYTNNYSICRTV